MIKYCLKYTRFALPILYNESLIKPYTKKERLFLIEVNPMRVSTRKIVLSTNSEPGKVDINRLRDFDRILNYYYYYFFVKIECGLYFLNRFDVLISKIIFKK